jgi:hypothetical protein
MQLIAFFLGDSEDENESDNESDKDEAVTEERV